MTATLAPCALDARAAATELAEGRLTAEALAMSCLDRYAEREPEVQAWAALDQDAFLAEARAADAAGRPGPLHGIPLGVKDIIATDRLPTTCGSSLYADTVMPYDAAVVALSRLAGGIVMGKTVTTEFATYHAGKTRNPHDVTRTPGGSSSGSAAAVAAGMVPLALGTQTAGSIIRPAAFCGVVGYKPSWGLIEMAGVKPLASSLDTLGVFSRSVPDATFYVDAVTGLFLTEATLAAERPMVIGMCRSPAWDRAEPDMQAAWERLYSTLSTRADVKEVTLPDEYGQAITVQERIMARQAFLALSHERRTGGKGLSPKLVALLDQGRDISADQHAADLAFMNYLRGTFAQTIGQTPVLVTPSAPGSAPSAVSGTGEPAFNRLWTLLGTPCVNVPGLQDGAGLPMGIQVVAAKGDDKRALAAAHWLERDILLRGDRG